jgi:hypothetical protein
MPRKQKQPLRPLTQEERAQLEQIARAWNRAPTPLVWGGARHQRRERARQRRHALGGSGACTLRPVARLSRKGYAHAN